MAAVRTFAEVWDEKERAGYQYGPEALEGVRFGWRLSDQEYRPHVAELEQRIATLEAALRPFAARSDEVLRCEHCGWPLVAKGEHGCWEDNCSMRPMPPKRGDIGSANDRVRARLALDVVKPVGGGS